MSAVDLLALALMAMGLLATHAPPRDEFDASSLLERWLATALLNAAALSLWNAAGEPAAAFEHWLLALVPLLALRFLLQAIVRAPRVMNPLRRYAPTATAALSLLWLYGPRH
ncbi:MAG: hypothetical protein ACREVL_19090 [Solimonas sp.]